MLPFKLIYDQGYDPNLGAHVFPSRKYRLIQERLLSEGFAAPSDFIPPEPASDDDLLLVHERGWITRLKHGTLDYLELMKLEIPYSRQMVEAFRLATGGSILAARLALSSGSRSGIGFGIGYNLGGGFHHAFADHGEGFCAINDIAVAIRKLQQERLIERAMVIDCDAHDGNGTASIFSSDPTVFTLSIHQLNNYPDVKPPSSLDINLDDGVEDDGYLRRLGDGCDEALSHFQPQLIVYVAGADPYQEDQLGGLSLTMEGLRLRDRLIFGLARGLRLPVAVTLAGGYAVRIEDTVAIHCNTVKAAAESMCNRSNG